MQPVHMIWRLFVEMIDLSHGHSGPDLLIKNLDSCSLFRQTVGFPDHFQFLLLLSEINFERDVFRFCLTWCHYSLEELNKPGFKTPLQSV